VIGVLLVLQAALSPHCTTESLCRLLWSAAEENRRATFTSRAYRARSETESATLRRWEGRIEGATILEQTTSEVQSDGDEFTQRVIGYRSFPNAIPLSRLAFMKIGWMVPSLVGQRILVIPRNAPGQSRYRETSDGPLAPVVVVHPLATDRDRYYRYSHGERITRIIDGAARIVDYIEVTIVDAPPRDLSLFQGEMDLEPLTHAVIRLKGVFRWRSGKRSGGRLSLSRMFEPSETLVELVSQRLPGGQWVPLAQRFEIQADNVLASGYGTTRRVSSRFYDPGVQIHIPRSASTRSIPSYSVTAAPVHSLRRFRAWQTPAGAATDAVADADFGRLRPDRFQPDGHPILLLQGYDSGHFLRVNRIEGLFTGASLILRLRNAAPGMSLRATAGYAWWEEAVRGAAGARWTRSPWMLEAGVARSLDVTNDFRDQFDNPNLSALVGRDPWDYVDRRGGGVAAARSLDARGSMARVELAYVEDRAVSRHMDKSLLGRLLRDNRTIAEGSYLRTRLVLDWHPAVSPVVARDGIGARAELEQAGGDLDYTRVEGRLVLRKSLRPLFLMARLHAGAVFADRPPPQQLFELGGPAGFPGYEYKEFAGNRALLFRARVSYPLPWLDTPVSIGRGITLPAFAPAISFGLQTGLADATTPSARDAVASLGVRRDDGTGALVRDPVTGAVLPASVPTGTLKTSVDLRVGIFGDALGVGLARALSQGRKILFFVAIGRQF
jgi:hypothetical protein